jgi:hypothetical protein
MDRYNSDDGAYGGDDYGNNYGGDERGNEYDEYDEYDEYEYDNPETQFQNEYNYLDRIGGYLDQDNLIRKDNFDPVQRFINLVRSSALDLDTNDVVNVKKDIDFLLRSISQFKNVQYKNPTAFVLGYCVIKNNQIDLQSFKHIKNKLEKVSNPVRDYDIIRYANLWLNSLAL